MALGDIAQITTQILTNNIADLVNKGAIAEQIVGLEILRYRTPNLRHELYYWVRQAKNAQAEIDYITNYNQAVLPIEVKAGTQGGMKSLWAFMRDKNLTHAIRCSLENFGTFTYTDQETNTIRNVSVHPIYAISTMLK